MKLADLPVHGRKSNKHKLIHGAGPSPQQVLYYKDPDTFLDELMQTDAIPRELGVQLNKSLLSGL